LGDGAGAVGSQGSKTAFAQGDADAGDLVATGMAQCHDTGERGRQQQA
jgi:hypothetical protein